MEICIIGTGYVGLVTGACFAEMGNEVIGVDIDADKIEQLRRGQVPIFEPGLAEMLQRNIRQGRLAFSTNLKKAVQKSGLIFIAVGTPPGKDGAGDVGAVLSAARQVARALDSEKIVVLKSTVPVGTTQRVKEEMEALTGWPIQVASNPEFLKEGAALDDFMRPDRVVIGTNDAGAAEILRELYAPFTRTGAPILVMDPRSAEMTKYAANAMLATRISFINEIANLCERLGADVNWVRQGVGLDQRIGRSFLFPGVGYGGSCFPKDLDALVALGRQSGYQLELIPAVRSVNERQKQVLIDKILKFYSSESSASQPPPSRRGGAKSKLPAPGLEVNNQDLHQMPAPVEEGKPLRGKTFAVWGLAFKPQTDDIREAPSLPMIERLLQLGARVRAYDPEAVPQARRVFGDRISYAESHYKALRGADALILVTEWHLFRNPDFEKVKSLLRQPVIFDGRNQYNPRELKQLGFRYFGIGRP